MTTWGPLSPGGGSLAQGTVPPDARLVDREAEQQRILRAVADARRRQGSVLLVTGEAGIGKTRLSAELAARQRRTRALVLEGTPGPDPQP